MREKLGKYGVLIIIKLVKYKTLIIFIIPLLVSTYALLLAYEANDISIASNDIAKKSNEISNLTYEHTFNSGEIQPIKPSVYFIIRGVDSFPSDYLILPIEWKNMGGIPELIRHPKLILHREDGVDFTFDMAGEYVDLTNLERPFILKQSFTIDPHTISQKALVFHIHKWWDPSDPLYRFRFYSNQSYQVIINYERYPDNQSEMPLFNMTIYSGADKLNADRSKGYWWEEWEIY